MSERARLWQRVSTGGQDEANQLPDLIAWCESHGYEYDVSERYQIKASAYHGKQIKLLEKAVADMENGEYQVLVFWAADRMWRSKDAPQALALVTRIVTTGGRLEFVHDEDLNRNPDTDKDPWRWYEDFSRTIGRAHKESLRKGERIAAKHRALRNAGSVIGRAPWGYSIQERSGIKILVPTPEGRRYIPQIFQRVIDGQSLRSIAAWLDSEGVSTESGKPWNEASIGTHMLKNVTYTGQRPNAGNLETEALVSPTVFAEANAALRSRYRPGRAGTVNAKPLVAPICGACFGQVRDGCPSGKSPMYRVFTGKGKFRKPYFRCSGHGPKRLGCGAPMIPVESLESEIAEAMLLNDMPHEERIFIPGDDRSDEIARLRERGAEAMRKGDYKAAAAAMQEAEQLEALPATRPHWERRLTETTEGEYFASLDRDAQRQYLATRYEITAERIDGEIHTGIVGREFTG